MSSRKNFKAWFANQIEKLKPDRNAGFVIAMITFPLLERYLRQKTGAAPKSPAFSAGLLKVLPELKTATAAKVFWRSYRHGLLHNVTLSRQSHGLTHDRAIVTVEANGRVWLNPVLFAEKVIATIESDFSTFEKGPLLPVVTAYATPPQTSGFSTIYLGTGTPPGSGRP